jgi:hypothetical protein
MKHKPTFPAKLGKWGTSVALRVPAGQARMADLEEGDEVIVQIVEKRNDAPSGMLTNSEVAHVSA